MERRGDQKADVVMLIYGLILGILVCVLVSVFWGWPLC